MDLNQFVVAQWKGDPRDAAPLRASRATEQPDWRCPCGHHVQSHDLRDKMPCTVRGCDCRGWTPRTEG